MMSHLFQPKGKLIYKVNTNPTAQNLENRCCPRFHVNELSPNSH